jgi:hypothetical protein
MVHFVLADPVPEARATAAKTLGTLVERLGEVHFPDLVPGLLRTLKTEMSGVDRQGLSEVLSGLGMDRLEGLLPDIIANAHSPRSTVCERFMSLLVYLPATFGTRFQPHLPKIIAPILSRLSDAEEYVRGRLIVTNYSSKAINLLLPELEQGMFDARWRIGVGCLFVLSCRRFARLIVCITSSSNRRSRWWESCCSRCLELRASSILGRTRRWPRLLWPSRLVGR